MSAPLRFCCRLGAITLLLRPVCCIIAGSFTFATFKLHLQKPNTTPGHRRRGFTSRRTKHALRLPEGTIWTQCQCPPIMRTQSLPTQQTTCPDTTLWLPTPEGAGHGCVAGKTNSLPLGALVVRFFRPKGTLRPARLAGKGACYENNALLPRPPSVAMLSMYSGHSTPGLIFLNPAYASQGRRRCHRLCRLNTAPCGAFCVTACRLH